MRSEVSLKSRSAVSQGDVEQTHEAAQAYFSGDRFGTCFMILILTVEALSRVSTKKYNSECFAYAES